MLEENFFLPILTRDLVSPIADWRVRVASDLDQPKFKTTLFQAIGFRLQRNYLWIFLIILVAWVLKVFAHPTPAATFADVYQRMAVGPVPSGVVLACYRRGLPVDEIKGLEMELEHWKV